MQLQRLPLQPHPLNSYLRVGRLLHWSLLLFIVESVWYGIGLKQAMEVGSVYVIGFWLGCFLFSMIHIYLVIMDGWSRFQDYKRAKDLFFVYGFQSRIANMYLGSKCQRMAVETAAIELGFESEIDAYFEVRGIKWHHFIPYFMLKDPFFIFKNYFWSRTFLEKNYTPKFNYKALSVCQEIC